MKVNYTFRHRNWSNYLVEYTSKKLIKLEKFESHNPFTINVTFMDEKEERTVNVQIDCDGQHYSAVISSDDYFDAIDSAFEKIEKQMEKKKTMKKSGKMRRLKNQKAVLQAEESLRRKTA